MGMMWAMMGWSVNNPPLITNRASRSHRATPLDARRSLKDVGILGFSLFKHSHADPRV
jgi:hypothetical protein